MIDMIIKIMMDLLNIQEGKEQKGQKGQKERKGQKEQKERKENKKNKKKKRRLICLVCFILFCFNMFLTFPFGSYIVEIMDFVTGIATIYVLAFCEIFALLNYYGINNFINDIYFMTNVKLPYFITYVYLCVIPLVLIVLFLVSICLLVIPHQDGPYKGIKKNDETTIENKLCLANIDCNENGICEDAECICNIGWKGLRCEYPYYTQEVVSTDLSSSGDKSLEEGEESQIFSFASPTELRKQEKEETSTPDRAEKEKGKLEKDNVKKDNVEKDNVEKDNVEKRNENFSETKTEQQDTLSKHGVKLIQQSNFYFNVFDDSNTNYSLIPLDQWKLILNKHYQENDRRFIFQKEKMEELIQLENLEEVKSKKKDDETTEKGDEQNSEELYKNDIHEKGNGSFLQNEDDMKENPVNVSEETLSKTTTENKRRMLKRRQIETNVEMVDNKEINIDEKYSQVYMNSFYYKSFTYDNLLVTPLLSCPSFCNVDFGKGICVNTIFKEKGFDKNNLKHIENMMVLNDVSASHYDKIEFYENTKISQIGNIVIHDFSGKCLCDVEFIGKSCSSNKYIIGYSSFFIFIGWCFVFITLFPIPIIFFFPQIRNMFMKFLQINTKTNMDTRRRSSSPSIKKRSRRRQKDKICDIVSDFDWKFVGKKERKKKKMSFNNATDTNESSKKKNSDKNKHSFKKSEKKRKYGKYNNQNTIPILPNWNFQSICKRKVRKKSLTNNAIILWKKKRRDIKIRDLKKQHFFFKNTANNENSEKVEKKKTVAFPNYFFNRNKHWKKQKKNTYSQIQEINVDFSEKNESRDTTV